MEKGKLNIVNRDTYKQFMPSPLTHYKVSTKITGLRVVRISPDREYKELKKRHMNIDITDPRIYVSRNRKPENGIYSPLFGADSSQDVPVYSCDCRELTGGTNRGRICPKCHTECRTIDADLRRYGTIDIYPYHMLTFHGYCAFRKLFKSAVMKEIVTNSAKIDKKGHLVKNDLPTIEDLYEDYDDVYKDKIHLPKDIVFMSKIPVYTSRLRPLIQFGASMAILEVNKNFTSMVVGRNSLKTAPYIYNLNRDVEIQKTISQLQLDYQAVVDHVTSQLARKKGAFRQLLASGRVDNSSRLVITLGDDLMAHEVDVPYHTMMVLAEDRIAHYLSIMDDIPISKAISLVEENANEYNPKFAKIIKQLLKQGHGIWGLVNRNPTISESGILYCRIRKIHDDPTDMTMHMPQDILGLLAADFDWALVRGHSPALQECGCCA